MGKTLKRLRKIFLTCLFAGIVIIGITLFLFWLEHNMEIVLPEPTGEFAVGRTTFDWIDNSRTDSLAPVDKVKRELFVWVWYPAENTKTNKATDYLPAEWRKALKERQGILLSKFITRDPTKVGVKSVADAKLSPDADRYPIVLMKSGIGALATDYTTFAEDLASHGYIVVGSDAPYSTSVVVFPDGRVITGTGQGNPGHGAPSDERDRLLDRLVNIWSDDTRFILNKLGELNAGDTVNRFHGRLDLESVGIFGHSFGGATALQFCRDDARCKAGINIDGKPFGSVIQTGLTKPFMFLLADHDEESDPESLQIMSDVESIYNKLPEGRAWISLRGSKHFNFSDHALLKERFISRTFGALGPIGEKRGLEVAASCLRIFFDKHLKGRPTAKIEDLPRQYSEVRLGK